MANPILPGTLYPTKDIYEAVWYSLSASIYAATIAVNDTHTVYGLVYTVSSIQNGSTGVAGTIKVTDANGAVYEFPNYVAPGYAATAAQSQSKAAFGEYVPQQVYTSGFPQNA